MHRLFLIYIATILLAGTVAGQPSLVAPRAVVIDPDSNDEVLYWLNGDDRKLQGSIAKLMTAYVTTWANKKGFVNWTDPVPLDLRATQQGCSCMKFNRSFSGPNCTKPSSVSITQPNDTFLLRDLLQVTLNQSTGESADAIAEYVAAKVYGFQQLSPPKQQVCGIDFSDPQNGSKWSECLMNLFVGLMNEHTKDAGLNLTNSRWITVHGGDGCDFSIGCDPDCKLGSCNLATCQKGQTCSGAGTTVHDVARLWHRLTVMDPNFLPLIGARAFSLKTSSKAFYNSYNHAFGFYYPGVAGDKNGGSNACPVTSGSASCWTAEAVRAGHPLIAAVLQSFTNPKPNVFIASGAADVAALFTYGYSFVLAPVRKVDSGNQASDVVKDHALACDEGTCYSAFRTQNDTLHITAWNVNTDAPLLNRLATFDASSYGPVTSLDVATHFYRVVTGFASGGNIKLARWEISSNVGPGHTLIFKGDSGAQAGSGTWVRVISLSDDLLLSVVRGQDGVMRLATWQTTANGFDLLSSATSAGAPVLGSDDEVTVAAGPEPLDPGPKIPNYSKNFHVVTFVAPKGGATSLQAWRVLNGSGTITFLNSLPVTAGSNIGIANDGRGKYGTTMISGGKLRMDMWDVDFAGNFTSVLSLTEPSSSSETAIAAIGPAAKRSGIYQPPVLPASTNTVTPPACAPGPPPPPQSPPTQFDPAAFLAATVSAGSGQLSVWDAPSYFNEAAGLPLSDFRVASNGSAWGVAGRIRVARLGHNDQYVTEHVRSDGTMQLIAWGIGSLPRVNPKCVKAKADLEAAKEELGDLDSLPPTTDPDEIKDRARRRKLALDKIAAAEKDVAAYCVPE